MAAWAALEELHKAVTARGHPLAPSSKQLGCLFYKIYTPLHAHTNLQEQLGKAVVREILSTCSREYSTIMDYSKDSNGIRVSHK